MEAVKRAYWLIIYTTILAHNLDMKLKELFPIFSTYPELVFVDNASTTQKPKIVIDALTEFYTKYNANVHRGLYPLSEKATELYEDTRIKIAKFINAEPAEIIFTSGTTDGVNAIAQSLITSGMIPQEPKVLLTELEHHSNVLPWQRIAKEMFFIPVKTKAGQVTIDNVTTSDSSKMYSISEDEHFYSIESRYDILAISHISNVTGSIANVKKMAAFSRYHNAKDHFIVLDAAQSIGHIPVDVKKLDIDFAVFSGHKLYGPMGVGVLWAKKEHLDKMEPFRVGGGMIREVTRKSATWSDIPSKFEAGTPNVADVYALSKAVEFIEDIGFELIIEHEQHLRKYLISQLKTISEINIYHPDLSENAGAVVSISFNKAHPHDLAQYLGDHNICVRAGHHCVQILHKEVLEIPASLRISFGIYNTIEDIDKIIFHLKEAIGIYSRD